MVIATLCCLGTSHYSSSEYSPVTFDSSVAPFSLSLNHNSNYYECGSGGNFPVPRLWNPGEAVALFALQNDWVLLTEVSTKRLESAA
jgi:hypothetical protein